MTVTMNSFVFFDRFFNKNRLKEMLLWTFEQYGSDVALEFSERLKNLGFRMVVKGGFSLGPQDLWIPKEKRWVTRFTNIKLKIIMSSLYTYSNQAENLQIIL